MAMVLEVFSTATAIIGGSNDAWVSQFAVMPWSSPPELTVTTYRPYGKWRNTVFLAASSMVNIDAFRPVLQLGGVSVRPAVLVSLLLGALASHLAAQGTPPRSRSVQDVEARLATVDSND